MKIEKVIACVLAGTMLITTNVFSSLKSFSILNEQNVQSTDKITALLHEQIDKYSEETIPVVLWFNESGFDKIERSVKETIGFNLEDLELDYPTPSEELIKELCKAAEGEPDDYLAFLMKRHMELTAPTRAMEKEQTELYKKTRLSVLQELNKVSSQSVLNSLKLSSDDVGFVSSFAPMVVCRMTADEIASACDIREVTEIDFYSPIEVTECLTDFGTTKSTVGIQKINDILNLTGEDVNIGIYETCTVSSQYYSDNGLDASRVTIVGAPYYNGSTHSTYCAGIAAGSNGIAPSAHIKSSTCEYDWQNFDWADYSNAQLSNLEELINDGVDVISISWGSNNSSSCYNYFTKYIDFLIADTSTTIVCATGNTYNDYILSPSSAYNCIAVNGFVDTYNNQSQELLNNYSYDNGEGCYKPDVIGPSLNNGTSTATPYIAGMIALMYQYKPSLAARPELTKAILIGSCHRKCNKLLNGSTITPINETMQQGLTDHQGAGIPDMYRMISIVSQHTYGNGVLNSANSYERKVNFVQPNYNSSNINVSMAYLQTNVPSESTAGIRDDYNLSIKNNGFTYYSKKLNSSTEMIYRALTSDINYELKIYKFSGASETVRYAYAWSTDNERYFNNYGEEGVYYLKNYKSEYYLSRSSSTNNAIQTNYSNSLDNLWILDSSSSSGNSYELKNANLESSGLGLGGAIVSTNYYALEGDNASVSPISVTYDFATGTYTFKRTVNGSTYALGINGQSTSSGAYANWSPYSANNASQKWYLETANYRSGDIDCDGVISDDDRVMVLQSSLYLISFNNMQKYLADVNKDNIVNLSDAVSIAQIIASS